MNTKTFLPSVRRHGVLFLLLILALTGRAQTSQYMTYQGYLTDGNGNPLGSTNTGPKAYSVVFRVWGAATAGTEYYGELQTVTVDNGYFSVLLGQGTSYSSEPHPSLASVFGSNPANTYIEMTVLGIGVSGANVTILPRLQLVSTPYAYVAGSANALVNTNGATVLAASGGGIVIGQLNVTNLTAPTVTSTTLTVTNLNVVNLTGAGTASLPSLNAGTVSAGAVTVTNTVTANRLTVSNITSTASAVAFNSPVNFNQAASFNSTLSFATSPVFSGGLQVSSGVLDLDTANTQNIPNISQSANGTPQTNSYDIRFGGSAVGEGIYCNRVLGSPNAFGISFVTDFTNRLVVANGGNVGVGTASPVGAFQVATPLNANAFIVATSGYVGIGTLSPTWPVDIEESRIWSYGPYGFLNGSSSPAGYQNGSSGNVPVSFYAAGRVVCGAEFDATSDARTKEIIGRSDTKNDLATVRRLQITDYRKVDKAQFGGRLEKGVIAQEVEKVVPQAVSSSTNFIPDIYASPVAFGCTNQSLLVTMARPHGLVTGDLVRFMTDAGMREARVAAVTSPVAFTLANVSPAPQQLFVFGKQVGDVRAVNYDRLFTTGLGAIQELAKRVDELDAREAQLAKLEQKAARVASLEQEVADLKKLVAQLAAGKTGQAETATHPATAPVPVASRARLMVTASRDE